MRQKNLYQLLFTISFYSYSIDHVHNIYSNVDSSQSFKKLKLRTVFNIFENYLFNKNLYKFVITEVKIGTANKIILLIFKIVESPSWFIMENYKKIEKLIK